LAENYDHSEVGDSEAIDFGRKDRIVNEVIDPTLLQADQLLPHVEHPFSYSYLA
jgi:hypothetical protein